MEDDPNLVDVSPGTLSNDALITIARIVRVCAELEDTLNLWICKLSKSSEAATSILLGRSPISTKVSIAAALAQFTDDATYDMHKQAFNEGTQRLLSCRNAVAHGVLIGQTSKGYAFGTSANTDLEPSILWRRVDVFSAETLADMAESGELFLRITNILLGLKPLRDKRQWQRLPEIRRDQPKQKSASKRKRQPQS
jgi:hypothetical protein